MSCFVCSYSTIFSYLSSFLASWFTRGLSGWLPSRFTRGFFSRLSLLAHHLNSRGLSSWLVSRFPWWYTSRLSCWLACQLSCWFSCWLTGWLARGLPCQLSCWFYCWFHCWFYRSLTSEFLPQAPLSVPSLLTSTFSISPERSFLMVHQLARQWTHQLVQLMQLSMLTCLLATTASY
jgi:hypothetical protein